jgi:hypothetical protein
VERTLLSAAFDVDFDFDLDVDSYQDMPSGISPEFSALKGRGFSRATTTNPYRLSFAPEPDPERSRRGRRRKESAVLSAAPVEERRFSAASGEKLCGL